MEVIERDIDDDETFDVWQFLCDGVYEKVRGNVDVKEALKAAYHYTHNVAAAAGITERVIIVDSGDCTVFEWINGQGVVHPKPEVTITSYKKLH